MKNLAISFLVIVTACSIYSCASTRPVTVPQDPAKAQENARQALRLEEEGKFDEAIRLLDEAQKLDVKKIGYPYELAYAYYAKKDYKIAADCLEALTDDSDVFDLVYQLLGNCYDEMGDSKKALATYDKGLDKFPKSGKLYLEKGNIYNNKKERAEALKNYERGIEVEPQFPSNYYQASRIFCLLTEDEVWGMLYGEIFMNLERNTARTAEISKMLYKTYKREITIGEKKSKVSFCQNISLDIVFDRDMKNLKLPFGTVYEAGLGVALENEKQIDIVSLDRIRTRFIRGYYQATFNKTNPNILFEYQKKLLDAGHLEAYNYWILMKGDEEGFTNWQSANKEKWEKFTEWFAKNPLALDEDHCFYRAQY